MGILQSLLTPPTTLPTQVPFLELVALGCQALGGHVGCRIRMRGSVRRLGEDLLSLLSFLWFLRFRVGFWGKEERADLCTDKSPCHGAGIQLMNVIGKAICLRRKRKEVK